jgi:hypothetical protein
MTGLDQLVGRGNKICVGFCLIHFMPGILVLKIISFQDLTTVTNVKNTCKWLSGQFQTLKV